MQIALKWNQQRKSHREQQEVPNQSSEKEKKEFFSAEAIGLLIDLWADKIKELRGARRNNHIYQEMQVILERHGLEANVEDIKNRIHNLTTRYR